MFFETRLRYKTHILKPIAVIRHFTWKKQSWFEFPKLIYFILVKLALCNIGTVNCICSNISHEKLLFITNNKNNLSNQALKTHWQL